MPASASASTRPGAIPPIRTVARLSGWTIGYVVANQIALFVVLALANGEGAGSVSAYTYAFIFFQLPHGLFAVSIMTTFMPDLAGLAAAATCQGFRERFGLGLRLLTLVVLPAAVGYIVLARPLVAMLLERGAFGGASSQLTAEVLVAFSLGPARVLGLPLRAARLLRLQGHPDPLLPQPGRERREHRRSPSRWSAPSVSKAWRWPTPSPTPFGAVLALGALRRRGRRPGRSAHHGQRLPDGRGRRGHGCGRVGHQPGRRRQLRLGSRDPHHGGRRRRCHRLRRGARTPCGCRR